MLRLGVEAHAPLAQRLDRRPRRLLHPAPPLQRDQRLDPRVAALAGADGVAVVLPLHELAALLEPGDDRRVRLRLRQALRDRRPASFILPSSPITIGSGSPWSRPISKSGGSWPGRDLERARAERRVDARVGDHGHGALDVRDDDLAADRVAVALVVRVHRDGDVAEDRRGPHRRDHDAVARRRRRQTGSGRSVSTSSISSCTTSRSEIAVWWKGHQLTIRFAR